MTRRNIDSNEINSHPPLSFHHPRPDQIEAMVREAHEMRARAMADTARWLWRLVTRRRAAAPTATTAAIKA
jgi:hypothetical protein